MFQSPSLRGSGRFASTTLRVADADDRFNPLHCGAVVASPGVHGGVIRRESVSIPFIAGQWSLRKRKTNSLQVRIVRFNPLHCGAVVASAVERGDPAMHGVVSIPFIAGQWSLRICPILGRAVRMAGFNPLHCGAVVASRHLAAAAHVWRVFQSPSLRGSGRFHDTGPSNQNVRKCFNPLHCGAVVASLTVVNATPHEVTFVSIPFIAGQWSLRGAGARGSRSARSFQSPSLRGSGRFQDRSRPRRGTLQGFNPLHCGAVVASGADLAEERCNVVFQSPSLRGSGRFALARKSARSARSSFNPLHCGAVVASKECNAPAAALLLVSIPFIAGQWSLRLPPPSGGGATSGCFNPLHCGAVVASKRRRGKPPSGAPLFQSPSLRGSGRFDPPRWCGGSPTATFQSPSLRGSGRFRPLPPCHTAGVPMFQSPSLRGSGRFAPWEESMNVNDESFNPLHCGAVVASGLAFLADVRTPRFNPLHCGAVVASALPAAGGRGFGESFNPLHCGAVVASRRASGLADRHL